MAEHQFPTPDPRYPIRPGMEFQKLLEIATKYSTFDAPGMDRGGFGTALPPQEDRFIYARLTEREDYESGSGASDPAYSGSDDGPYRYAWEEVIPDGRGGWIVSSAGSYGNFAQLPAYELNRIPVSVPTIVILYKGSDNYMLFSAGDGNGFTGIKPRVTSVTCIDGILVVESEDEVIFRGVIQVL